MARISDHPMRIARLHANLSQNELAKRAGVNRAAISAIEDGRTKMPTDNLIGTIAPLVGMDESMLKKEIKDWLNKPVLPLVCSVAGGDCSNPNSFCEYAPHESAYYSRLREREIPKDA